MGACAGGWLSAVVLLGRALGDLGALQHWSQLSLQSRDDLVRNLPDSSERRVIARRAVINVLPGDGVIPTDPPAEPVLLAQQLVHRVDLGIEVRTTLSVRDGEALSVRLR